MTMLWRLFGFPLIWIMSHLPATIRRWNPYVLWFFNPAIQRRLLIRSLLPWVAGSAFAATAPLTEIAQIYRLSPEEASNGQEVRLEVVVTHADLLWNLLFVQDKTRGMFLIPSGIKTEPQPGDLVELTGKTWVEDQTIRVINPQLRPLGPGAFPPAIPATLGDLFSGKLSAQWVETTGVLRRAEVLDGRMRFELVKGTGRLSGYVRHGLSATQDVDSIIGAELRVQGVCANRFEGSRIVAVSLHIPHLTNVTILTPSSRQRLAYPITSIKRQRDNPVVGEKAQRTHLRGKVMRKHAASTEQPASFVLEDLTGTIVVMTREREPISINDRLEVWGFPTYLNREVVMEDAVYAVMRESTIAASPESTSRPSSTVQEPLRRVAAVRALSKSQAANQLPVLLNGIVTYVDHAWNHFFIQDETGAIYVRGGDRDLEAGHRVELQGITDPGGIARMIVEPKVVVLGQTNLPPPLQVDLRDLLSEAYDCAWVQLDGVVRSVDDLAPHALLKLTCPQGRFEVVIPGMGGGAMFRHLVNSRLRIQGVATGILNDRDQWVSLRLRTPSTNHLEIMEAPPLNPFGIESRPIRAIRFGNPELIGLQRVRIRGMVTLISSERDFNLQDGTAAIPIRMANTDAVRVGDSLDLVGFPDWNGTSIQLVDALHRPDEHPIKISARPVQASDILPEGHYDRELVTLSGILRNDAGGSTLPTLLVQSGPVVFQAQFETGQQEIHPPFWYSGSSVELTGVCMVQTSEQREPRSFVLFLRSPSDVVVVRHPPWWTMRHALTLGSVMLLLVLSALAWVGLLKRQVRHQTERVRDQVRREAALEKRYQNITQSLPLGMHVYELDQQGRLVFQGANPAADQLLGIDHRQFISKPIEEAFPMLKQTDIPDRYRKVARTGESWRGEQIDYQDGKIQGIFEVHAFQTTPDSMAAVFQDVTHRKRAEEEKEKLQVQLLQAQKLESIGRFAGGVAHDFNNMLQVILGNTSLLLSGSNLDPDFATDLQEIEKAAQRSADLTRQLLAFARKQTANPRILDINSTVGGMLSMLKRLIGENIQLHWLPGENLWRVKVDPVQLDQILVNLIANARDAIHNDGRITIRTANVIMEERQVETTPGECVPGRYVSLTVTDTGHGISKENLDHIFEPFFTTKEVGKGTGLGLATVFGIVKQNQGLIQVDSKLGQGTTFRIYLPSVELVESDEANIPAKPISKQTETILLVEDEVPVLHLTQKMLAQYGYTVLSAASPQEALELAARHSGKIHLLITDVVMPGMNGRTLRDRMMVLQPELHCLFMSGYTADVIAHHGVLDKGVEFIQKPFSAQELGAKVQSILGTDSV